jgi:hypothetical protein
MPCMTVNRHFSLMSLLPAVLYRVGQAAVLLSSLLHALYITVETVNTNRRKIKSLRRGGYRVHRKADTVGSEGRETSSAVPALASRHLYTVCVCLLMMVSSQAVQPLLSSTVAAPWYLERRHKQVSGALISSEPSECVLHSTFGGWVTFYYTVLHSTILYYTAHVLYCTLL